MRIVSALLAAGLATAAVAGCASSGADQKLQKDAIVKSVTIPIEGMACDSCAARIQKNLVGIDGVVGAAVSFDKKSAVVEYDARRLEPGRLASAITGLGFKAGAPLEVTP
jgi:copper chaperone CopZ